MNKTLILALLLLATGPVQALDILLTNDDGYQEPGINIMFDVLTAAGHNVVMVAPKTEQSGRGMAWNTQLFGFVEIGSAGPNKWFVDGTPVDCVQAGIDIFFGTAGNGKKPDVIVSGANFGQNAGLLVPQSGTVGAAQKGLLRGIPSIAVSVERASEAATVGAMDDAARFTAQIIDKISQRPYRRPFFCPWVPNYYLCRVPEQKLNLPPGVGLNINYPALDAADTAGAVYTQISSWTPIDFTIFATDPSNPALGGFAAFELDQRPPTEREKHEDAYLLDQGYVTVTALDPDLNVGPAEDYLIQKALGDLAP
ncbi:MAG: 5'/3'-nucleotidase SurE [Gammaproteobacteria bacterium]|nr:5'/3'-nucleotidase SurE [Gammaproteobacteria bacterium]